MKAYYQLSKMCLFTNSKCIQWTIPNQLEKIRLPSKRWLGAAEKGRFACQKEEAWFDSHRCGKHVEFETNEAAGMCTHKVNAESSRTVK